MNVPSKKLIQEQVKRALHL